VAQAAASASKAFAWTLRVYDAIPVAAGWTGALLAAVLDSLFLVVETALGRTPIPLDEWPFDASTFRRFGLYLMIPLGSWMGAALVERLINGLLE
jgi:hypothetical protein